MSVRTKRWNDPVEPEDGTRILVCRYRPRGVKREDETWHEWMQELAPSVALHAAAYGKEAPTIPFDEYETRYLSEMSRHDHLIAALGGRVHRGETLTLLCSSACTDAALCHRTLLAGLIRAASGDDDA